MKRGRIAPKLQKTLKNCTLKETVTSFEQKFVSADLLEKLYFAIYFC